MNECLIWASLSDKAAVDEPLTGEERLFLRSHPNNCRACSAEAGMWTRLEQVLDAPERLTSRSQGGGRAAPSGRHARFRLGRGAPLLACAITAAAAASAALWSGTSDSVPPTRLPAQAAKPASAPVALAGPSSARLTPTAELGTTSNKEPSRTLREAAASTPAALLRRARELRAASRYREAHVAYQRLLQEHAASPEAHVALVSLGELQLSQLGNPSAALRCFDAYLRGAGALRQEASYGRIRALRRLGRLTEAKAAADAFMSAYPTSLQAATLRKEQP